MKLTRSPQGHRVRSKRRHGGDRAAYRQAVRLTPMRAFFLATFVAALFALACSGHSKVAGTNTATRQPADPEFRERWNSMIAEHMERCRTLPLCRRISAERPCDCEGETFPCKESDFDDEAPGCQVRISCTRAAMGDSTAPPIEGLVLCGRFGEEWRARARKDEELQQRFIATVPGRLGPEKWPMTCDAAADMLLLGFDAELRATLRGMEKPELIRFHHGWGQAIRNGLGMWRGNTSLVKSCTEGRQDDVEFPDAASMALIEVIWQRLQGTE